jgi:murein DD-endopeptidase MepM/ murein hydrolase activator NlpD
MKKEQQIPLAIVITLGLAGCGGVGIKPELGKTQVFDTQTPTTFIPSPTKEILASPTVLPSATFTPTFTSSSTPEATLEILKCVFPLKEFTIISSFLEKRFSHNNEVTYHLGVDFSTESEDKRDILSPCKGTLLYAGPTDGDPTDSLGNVVVIQYEWNGEPIYAVFAHLEKVVEGKKEGDIISTGEVIGKMGQSGTDNIHLHLQVWNRTGWKQIVVGINNQRLERYGWPYVASTYPHWDNKETVEKYLINPYAWLENITGRDLK